MSTPHHRAPAPHGLFIGLAVLVLGLVFLTPIANDHPRSTSASESDPVQMERLRHLAQRDGRVRVIVELRLSGSSYVPEGHLRGQAAVFLQRQDITSTRARVLSRLRRALHRVVHHYDGLPLVALEVGPAALAELEAAGFYVKRIAEDKPRSRSLGQSAPLVQGDQAWVKGYDGTGTVIAIIDDGIDETHQFLAGKVVEEACYVPGGGCPNGESSQTGPGAGVPCPACDHGTHVAGIAAGNGDAAGVLFSGVAKGASLMAVNVFGANDAAFDSDIIAGLNRVHALRGTHNFAAVNMSLGGGLFSTTCDATYPQYKMVIDNLLSAGIPTVVASGNDDSTNQISAPACISSAVSVGSTTKSDVISSFSNIAPFLSLLAPGSSINSSILGGGFAFFSGTSMATPHVAGTFAILKQAAPTATGTEMLNALQATGLPVTDTRHGAGVTKSSHVTKPRIRIVQALAALVLPTVDNLTTDKSAPQPAGTNILVTANVSGGIAPLQYKWWATSDGLNWSVIQDWSPSNTVTWSPTMVNANSRVGVWVKNGDNPNDTYQASGSIPFAITEPPPLALTGISTDNTAPQPTGTSILVTATATGGVAPLQYKWWATSDGANWSVIQNWSANNTVLWTPNTSGNDSRVGVWIKGANNPNDTYEASGSIPFAVTAGAAPQPLTLTSLTTNMNPPQSVGTAIQVTANTTGGTGPLQYKWWATSDGVNWSVIQDWSPNNVVTWTPAMPGANSRVGVWVKHASNPADTYEASGSIPFAITQIPQPPIPPPPVPTLTSLTTDKTAPQPAGTAIQVTAITSDGVQPLQFKWWATSDGVNWNVIQNWSTNNAVIWTPNTMGANSRVGVWVKNAGMQGDTYQASGSIPFAITAGAGPQPLTLTGLTTDKNPPQASGTAIQVIANTTGGTGPLQYKWWATSDGANWNVVQNWTMSNTVIWTPPFGGANSRVGVWVKSANNPNDTYDRAESTGSIPFAITGPPPPQVRFLNNLLICSNPTNPTDCTTSFTARLSASEGYMWFSTSGSYSPYQQVLTPTLSNFQGEAIGFDAMLNFPGTFNITPGQRYALIITTNDGQNVLLQLVSEGSVSAVPLQVPSVPGAVLPGQWQGDPTLDFAPAEGIPAFR